MKFSAVKRQLLDDQVESAKSLLSYTAEVERKGELEFNPYLKSEMAHLQKYVDQMSIKPKSPFSLYRRTEEEDLSYCLHRKHSKSMNTLSGLMKDINKELYRLKKLKQAEKKLEFLELFQSHSESDVAREGVGHMPGNLAPKMNQYKLPESQTFIPQLGSPKPKYEPISFHDEVNEVPEMSRAMEGFLKQQEKERNEKENKQLQQQKEIKPLAVFKPDQSLSSSDKKEKKGQIFNNNNNNKMTILKEHPLTTSGDTKIESNMMNDKKGISDSISSSSMQKTKPPLSFASLRQSGGPNYSSPHSPHPFTSSGGSFQSPHSHPYTSSDPERPYGAYSENGPYPHYISTLGRSSGTTL